MSAGSVVIVGALLHSLGVKVEVSDTVRQLERSSIAEEMILNLGRLTILGGLGR